MIISKPVMPISATADNIQFHEIVVEQQHARTLATKPKKKKVVLKTLRARKEYCEIVVVYNTMTSTEKVSLNLDVYMEEKTINIHATVHGILFSFFFTYVLDVSYYELRCSTACPCVCIY